MRLAGYSKAAISPFNIGNVVDEVAEALANNCEKFDITTEKDKEQLEYEWGYEVEHFIEEYPEIVQKVKHFGWDLYLGSVSDEDVEVGQLIAVSLKIDYKDDKIMIKKDSYY